MQALMQPQIQWLFHEVDQSQACAAYANVLGEVVSSIIEIMLSGSGLTQEFTFI